ncbi:MAG: helix-turn-helix transcriptional regulator [Lachnospiraceae bacterium]|nr:helix-turn-helix transcriptional regulator [Lachnospiraceae bacterium]
MRKNNHIGKLIGYERTRAGLQMEELCAGLCSRSFLVRVENGSRNCEKILTDALLQRAGVSADKFVYMINTEEQDWLLLREKLISAVDAGDEERAAPLMEQYHEMTENHCKLHRQLLLLLKVMLSWKNNGNKAEMQSRLREAWRITMTGTAMEKIPDMHAENKHLTLTEFVLVMMHYRILEEQEKIKEAAEGYKKLLRYLEISSDEEDRVKLYPQIAYRLAKIYLEQKQVAEAVALAEKAIELLKVRGRLFYLRQFLEILCTYKELEAEEKLELEEIIASLKWLYKRYEVEEEPWTWSIPFGMAEVELGGNLIRARRKVLGLSQEELSEGICDPVSISRIECCKVAPKREIYRKLLERVGMTGSRFENVVQMEQPELMELAMRIGILLSHTKGEEAEPLIAELEQKMKHAGKFARQYLLNVKAIALYDQEKITAEEHTAMQEEALYMTLPQVDLEKLAEWSFSRLEVNIINMLSYSCEATGKAEEMIELLQIIRRQYENKPFALEHYVVGYELTMRNLGNLLGNCGRYKEAIEIADKGIRLGVQAGRGVILSTALYDCGWDMEQMWKTGQYTKKESLPYVKASYALNCILGIESVQEFLKEHIHNLYLN